MALTWFNLLFAITFCLFLLKNIVSWIFGDTDVDLDFDGDTDIDISSMLSFKGILHFLMGFSFVLSASGYEQTHSFSTPCEFSVIIYIVAIMAGIFIMVALFLFYKAMLKLNSYSTENPEFDGMVGKVYLNEGGGRYQILINTQNGTFKKTAYSEKYGYITGDEVKVTFDKEKKRYVI